MSKLAVLNRLSPDYTGNFSVSFSGEKGMMLPAFKFMEIAYVWHGPSLE